MVLSQSYIWLIVFRFDYLVAHHLQGKLIKPHQSYQIENITISSPRNKIKRGHYGGDVGGGDVDGDGDCNDDDDYNGSNSKDLDKKNQ